MIFRWMADELGYNITIKSITKGAHTLELFMNVKDQYGAKVNRDLSEANKGMYDFVVLQEQSLRPARDDAYKLFYDGVRGLNEKIELVGAKGVLYMTWGRKEGNADAKAYGLTNESMTWKLANAYTAIGEELDMMVAPVGLGFYNLYSNGSPIELYATDGSHPSYEGSYFAALILFSTIFNVDPTTVTFDAAVDPAVAKTLKEAARDVILNTPEIPEQYKASSVGVTAK